MAPIGACTVPWESVRPDAADASPPTVDVIADARRDVADAGIDVAILRDVGDVVDAAPPCTAAAPCRDCAAILAAVPGARSGMFPIDPDGPGGEPTQDVYCDMDTQSGGWTVIFVAMNTDYATVDLEYTTTSTALRDHAADVLMAYRTDAMSVVPASHVARIPMPSNWRARAPFRYTDVDEMVDVSIDGAVPTSHLLRYGTLSFPSTLCDNPWLPGTTEGRICIQGTTAPHYTGFAIPGEPMYPADFCADSTQSLLKVPCTPMRRFSIAVR
jgi:hypothetical protein